MKKCVTPNQKCRAHTSAFCFMEQTEELTPTSDTAYKQLAVVCDILNLNCVVITVNLTILRTVLYLGTVWLSVKTFLDVCIYRPQAE